MTLAFGNLLNLWSCYWHRLQWIAYAIFDVIKVNV